MRYSTEAAITSMWITNNFLYFHRCLCMLWKIFTMVDEIKWFRYRQNFWKIQKISYSSFFYYMWSENNKLLCDGRFAWKNLPCSDKCYICGLLSYSKKAFRHKGISLISAVNRSGLVSFLSVYRGSVRSSVFFFGPKRQKGSEFFF